MSDLVEFLRARFDEDEEAAREAGNRRWLVQDNIIELYPEREDDGFMSWPTRADARHAARWEPARVLREVEAKRAMLSEHERIQKSLDAYPGGVNAASLIVAQTMLRFMAVVHADHPDYREERRT